MRIFVLALLMAFSNSAMAVEPEAPQSLITQDEALTITIANTARARAQVRAPRPYAKDIAEFYDQRLGRPIWIDGENFSQKATQAKLAIARADEFGLNSSDYSLPTENALKASSAPLLDRLANAEIEMSLGVVAYAVHAQAGRIRGQDISPALDPSPEIPEAESILQGAAETHGDIAVYLESFHPQHPQFLALKQRLAQIINRQNDGKSTPVPLIGPSLRPGATHPDITILRAKLKVPSPVAGESDHYDDSLSEAVKNFQKQNGLSPNGILTPSTRQAFESTPAPNRKLLIVNMERWRWARRSLGETHIRVNIPEFTVRLSRKGRIDFEERVVVGKTDQKTPVFSDEMEMVVFNPFWNVPESITANEILPILRRNPNYLARNGLEVFVKGQRGGPVDPYYVNWSSVNPDRVFIRQPPGNGNALGNVKFLFPNKHSVYLHDTPSKSLFNQNVRAFSHGCVRVRNPRKFAEAILGWSQEKVDRAIASGVEDNVIQVQPRIPVHIQYFTAWVGDRGDLQVFRDIYGHDAAMISALRL